MQLSSRQVIGLPVETKSGLKLGVVADFEIDTEQQAVARYVVKPALVPRLLARELMVGASQVVSITNEKIIVEDGVVSEPNAVTTPATSI